MKRLLVVSLTIAACIFWLRVSDVSAEGFSNVGFSAEAMGRGDAVIASIDDAAAMWYNPARSAYLEGHNLQINVDSIYPFMQFKPLSNNNVTTQSHKNESGLQQLPAIFYTYKPSFMEGRWTFGFGLTSPWGISVAYPRSSAVSSVCYKAKMSTLIFNPNAAYKINDKFAVALGIMALRTHITLNTVNVLNRQNGNVDIDFGTYLTYGANLAFAYKINDKQNLGLTYRSQLRVKCDEASAELSGYPGAYSFLNGKVDRFSTHFDFPDEVGIGWSIQLNEKVLWEISGIWRNWNDLKYVPYVREINDARSNVMLPDGKGVNYWWKNGGIVATGINYDVSDTWGFTAGYQYHQDPVPEYYALVMMPDTPQHAISGGINYNLTENIRISPAFLYGTNLSKNINAAGRSKDSFNSGATGSMDGEWTVNVYHLNLGATFKF